MVGDHQKDQVMNRSLELFSLTHSLSSREELEMDLMSDHAYVMKPL